MKQKRKNIQYLLIVGIIIIGLFIPKTSANAYTEEQKRMAKSWLSAHGYSPTREGAYQAISDYQNGKLKLSEKEQELVDKSGYKAKGTANKKNKSKNKSKNKPKKTTNKINKKNNNKNTATSNKSGKSDNTSDMDLSDDPDESVEPVEPDKPDKSLETDKSNKLDESVEPDESGKSLETDKSNKLDESVEPDESGKSVESNDSNISKATTEPIPESVICILGVVAILCVLVLCIKKLFKHIK